MAIGRVGGWDFRPHPEWLLPFPIPALPWGVRQTTLPHPHPTPPLIQFYIYK